MIKWFCLIVLLAMTSYWALSEKDAKVFEHDGVRLPWSIEDIKQSFRISIQKGETKISILRHPTGMWWLYEPEKGMANQYKVHDWLNILMMPKILRGMKPSEGHREKLKHAIKLEIEVEKNKSHVIQYFESAERPENAYLYIPNEDRLLVIERHHQLDQSLNLSDYRTLRIFPFRTEAVTMMTYEVKGKQYVMKKNEKGWEINFEMNPQWENLMKTMYNAFSKGFVETRLEGELLSSWEFEYESGDRSKVELFLTKKGYIAYYRGREIGQIINQSEVSTFFPGVFGK